MARGSQQAQQGATQSLALSNQLAGEGRGIYSTLAPELISESMNPTGFTPQEQAQMRTTSMQGAGGTQAGAVGQGALLAGRTRNAGTADAAIAESAREAGRQLGERGLQTDVENAQLKRQNQDRARAMLESMYGTNIGGANAALGENANNVNANTNAVNASWDWSKDLFAPILGAGASAAPILGAGASAAKYI